MGLKYQASAAHKEISSFEYSNFRNTPFNAALSSIKQVQTELSPTIFHNFDVPLTMSLSALAQTSIDLQVFQAMPGNSIVLLPDTPVFTIVAATDDYYTTSGRSKEELINIGMFDAFPSPPDDPEHKGVKQLRASLEKVIQQKTSDRMPLVRYDIENADGTFDERYWSAVNKPVVGENGEVRYIIHTAEEMTLQVKAEQSATRIKSLEKSYDLFMQAPVTIGVVKGSEYIIELANDSLLEVWGRTSEVIGKSLFEAIPELKDQGFKVLLDQVCGTGEPFYAYEHPIRLNRDGKEEVLYFDFVYKPYYEDGMAKPVGVLAVGHNVTKLVESRQKFKSVIEEAKDSILILMGEDMVLDTANQALFDLWHVGPEALGKAFLEILPEMKEQGIADLLKKVFHTGEPFYGKEVPVMFKRKSGVEETVYFDFSYQPYRNAEGSIAGVLVMTKDVSGQVMVKKRLEESERRFRLMADASPVMIWTLDAEGNSTYYNKRAIEFTGHTEKELKDGKTWQTTVHPEDISYALQVVSSAVQNHQPYQMECRMQRADGEWRWLLSHGMPRLDEKNELLGYVGSSVDITDRKMAEEVLLYRKALLEAQNDAIPDAILIVDTKGAMISYNNQFARLWNIPQAIIDAKDDRAALEFAMTQVADPQAFIDRVEYCYAYPNEAAYEQIPFADGRIIERYGNAVIGEDGASYGWIWYFRDITEQKKAEEKLRENEERFRTFADNIQNLAWIADAEGWIYWYNQRWYDYTGTTFEEMQGWGWEKVHHPDHSERVVNFVKEAWKKSEPFELTFPLRGRDGNFQWFLTRAVPIVDAEGKITRWIGTNTNINEQKLAQQKIEQSEAALNELANAMPQLVWIADATGAVTYYNNQLAGFANALKDEQDKWQWDSLVHVDDLQKTAEAWAAAVNAGTIYQVEHRIQMRDGKYRWYLSRGIPQKDVAGNVVKWFGTATDIHEQKQFTERLEKLVTERTKALQQSNDNLQQFAHVASHDLKEPVRKIKTFTSRLENELQNVLNEKSKLYLDKVQRATERMFVMIDGVLTYSTIDASKQAVELVDLNDIFKNIETDLEILIQQTGTRILYRDLPSVEGSSVLLYQLFYNLMNNAIKFARNGVPPVISVGFSIVHQEGQEFAQILFNDNGIGFEQEQAEKIFETFTRLHSKDKYEGTGLGLSLCKKIVERHGGRIQAKSRLDEGTTFIILLPLKHTSLGI